MKFNPNARLDTSQVQDRRGACDSRNLFDPPDHIAPVGAQRIRGIEAGRLKSHREEVIGPEAGIDGRERREGAEHEGRPDGQHHGESDLERHQGTTRPLASASGTAAETQVREAARGDPAQ